MGYHFISNTSSANDVMAALDTIYLALLTSRIPILAPFYPTHVGVTAGIVPFSSFFDVPLLSSTLNIPILDWKDIKNYSQPVLDTSKYFNADYYGGESEELGCWSVWMTSRAQGVYPREGEIPRALSLDVSWTPVQFGHQIDPKAEEYNLLALSGLSDPQMRTEAVRDAKESYLQKMWQTIGDAKAAGQGTVEYPPTMIPIPNRLSNQLDPDDNLLCFDYLYFTSTQKVRLSFDQANFQD
jgi:hypothetical protein